MIKVHAEIASINMLYPQKLSNTALSLVGRPELILYQALIVVEKLPLSFRVKKPEMVYPPM